MPRLPAFVAAFFMLLRVSAQNDSLLHVAASSQTHDTLRAKIYGDLSFESRFLDLELAKSFALESLSLAKRSGHQATLAQSWNDLGIVYYDLANYDSALLCYDASLKIRSSLGDLKGLGGLYNKIGIVYQSRGQLEEALRAQLESLRFYDSLDLDYGIAYAYNNIAILQNNLGNSEKALQYYQQSADIKLRIGDNDGYGGTLSNMGSIYSGKGKYRQALDHFHLALKYIDTARNKYYLASTCNNMGWVYAKLDMGDSAHYYVRRGLQIRRESGDKKGMVSSLALLGNLLVSNPKPENKRKGLEYLEESLALAREIDVLKDNRDVLSSLAEAHYRQGNFKAAYDYLSEGKALNDSIFSENLSRSVSELQVKYETEKQIRENLELKAEQERADARLRWILVAVSAGLLFILLAFQLYRSRQKQRVAEHIQQLEQESFRTILQTEEKERGRIARELHDGISQLIVSAKMHMDAADVPESERESINTASTLLTESLEEVRSISHDLLPSALVRLGLKEAIQESVNRANSGQRLQVQAELKLALNPPQETALALYRIYQECLGNMLKYSGADRIGVELFEEQGTLVLKMQDNGKGFDTSTIGSSKGIGWDNIRFRTSLLNGSFEVNSSPTTGSSLLVKVPLKENATVSSR